jgi:hypothetical protein
MQFFDTKTCQNLIHTIVLILEEFSSLSPNINCSVNFGRNKKAAL